MPIGTCDPATRGQPYNMTQMAQGDSGEVFVTIRWGWDGISTRSTRCVGPLVNGTGTGNVWAIKYSNTGSTTYYVHTVGKRGQPRVLTLHPGDAGTLTAAQAASAGYATNEDIDTLTITTVP